MGIFTNLTQDHLDFHKTMEAYCDAKAILFQNCDGGRVQRRRSLDRAAAAKCRMSAPTSMQSTPRQTCGRSISWSAADHIAFDAVTKT